MELTNRYGGRSALIITVIAACSDHHDPALVKAVPSASGSSGSSGSSDGMTMHRTQAGTPDANGWYLAHSDAGRFTVLMPAPFNDFSMNSLSEKGVPIATEAIGTQRPDGVKFSAVCNRGGDLSPTDALHVLPERMGAQAVRLSFKGYEAIEMRSTHPVGVMRAVAVRDQLCLLIVDPQGPTKVVPDTEANTMFESFAPDPPRHIH